MNKPGSHCGPLADVLRKTLTDAFAKQGFASVELSPLAGDRRGEIAAHSQPEKIQGRAPRKPETHRSPEPCCCRVEAPPRWRFSICRGHSGARESIFGWQAVAACAAQAPLARRAGPRPLRRPIPPPRRASPHPAEIRTRKLRHALDKLAPRWTR